MTFSSIQRTLEAYLAEATRRTLAQERPTIVAMTGSVGKSSTRQAVAAFLGAGRKDSGVRASAKNYNNELGLPLTVFDMSAPGRSPLAWTRLLLKAYLTAHGWCKTGVRTFILEMGADKQGDIAHLTHIAPPDVAIVTGVTPEDASLPPVHLAKYPSLEALTEEKATLVQQVRSDGVVVLNADDPRVFAMRHLTHAKVHTYGETDAADIRIMSREVKTEERPWGREPIGLEIHLQIYNHLKTYVIPGVFGRSIAYAWAAASGVADALDVSQECLDAAAAQFHALPGRTRIIQGRNGVTIFDDSYNASPAAMMAGLRDLGEVVLAPSQRRIAVIGEMREIGETAHVVHRRMGAEAAHLNLDLFIPCGTFAPAMKEGALANGIKEEQIVVCRDSLDAIPVLEKYLQPGDILFTKASEGPRPGTEFWNKVTGVRMERVVKAFMAEPERAAKLLCRQEPSWQRP